MKIGRREMVKKLKNFADVINGGPIEGKLYRVRRLLEDLNLVGDRFHNLRWSQNATALALQKMLTLG